jgi:hypothetical protein
LQLLKPTPDCDSDADSENSIRGFVDTHFAFLRQTMNVHKTDKPDVIRILGDTDIFPCEDTAGTDFTLSKQVSMKRSNRSLRQARFLHLKEIFERWCDFP